MYSTSTGIKKSFYSQTGNFQFKTELIVDTLLGGVNLGVSGLASGNISTSINYYCNSGKIIDNNNNFVGIYSPNQVFSISGNVKSGRYDYFINDVPIAYNNYKNTGTYNCFYINPSNISCDYSLYINGEIPNLTVSNISCWSGDLAGTGYITNSGLPLIIYSGGYSNFSTNLPFSFSSIFTGLLNNGESGAFHIYPQSNSASVGLYTGKMELFTNAGTLLYDTIINITGSPEVVTYNFNLNGLNYIVQNNIQLYTSDIECLFGSGIPIVISLEYYTGSGQYFYTGSNVTGTFTWPYSTLVSGYGTGIGYSGIGTGTFNYIQTGTIFDGSGIFLFSGYKTGNLTPIIENGGTISLITSGAVTGFVNNIFTGSGINNKTFTGSWNLLTGQDYDQVNYRSGGLYNIEKTKYLDIGNPVYYTNSTASINIQYNNLYDTMSDVAILTISGLNLNSGISLSITGVTGIY